MTHEEFIAEIEKMTVLELNDLVKALEEKFGVSAAAPVVVGGGVHADDMEMLAHSKAAGWFVVSAIAGASDPEEATRNMVSRWKAVRGDTKHGHVPHK